MRASLFFISLCLFSQVSWGRLRVCYYTNWAQYRPDPMKLWPENVDASLCTHIVYAFSDMDGNDLLPFEWNDHDLFGRLQALKNLYPDLRTLLSVGGRIFNLAKMTSMLSTEANRAEFINNSISYLREHGFDGLDLHFEYPGSKGSIPEDKFLFTKLVQEMRVEFDLEGQQTGRETLLMSAAVACGKENIDRGYEINLISVELDWVGLMSYDLSGAWDNITGFNSPLRSNDPATDVSYYTKSVDWCATYWNQSGAPKEKLIPGIAAHGRGFTLADPNNNGVNAPATGGPPLWGSVPAPFTREEGFFSYFEVCDLFLNGGSTVERPPIYDTPYTYFGDQWAGYDDIESVTLKAQYVCDNNYAGYLVWTLDLDDFNNNFCGEESSPLHTAAMSVISSCPSVTTPTPAPTTTTSTPASGTTTSPLPSGCVLYISVPLGVLLLLAVVVITVLIVLLKRRSKSHAHLQTNITASAQHHGDIEYENSDLIADIYLTTTTTSTQAEHHTEGERRTGSIQSSYVNVMNVNTGNQYEDLEEDTRQPTDDNQTPANQYETLHI